MCKEIIAIANQKGGVGKTTTSINLGIGLAMKGKKVLNIDCDPQGSMTAALGIKVPDELKETISSIFSKIINDEEFDPSYAIIHHDEGIDFVPSNTALAGMEIQLFSAMNRERILQQYIDKVKDRYDYIIIDCPGSLGIITVNALACADGVLITAQPQYLSSLAIQQLFKSITTAKKRLNPKLRIKGVLFTMTTRTNSCKDIITLINKIYGEHVNVFETKIPTSVKTADAPAKGTSIYKYDPKGKVAKAYSDLVQEVLNNE